MSDLTPEQIATYVARVARKTDVRRLLHTGGLESAPFGAGMEGPPDSRRAAEEGLERILAGTLPSYEQSAGVEAIILPKLRPVLDVVDGDFRTDHPLWLRLNTDQGVRGHLKSAIRSIGRIELPGDARYPYGGTGFVVGNGLLMTNRHVAAIFSRGVGMRVSYRSGTAGVDFVREIERPTGPTFPVRGIVMVHPYWDMALLRVELPDAVSSLRLAANGSGGSGTVAAIGYPAFDPRNDTDVQNDLFRRVFGVKRLQPGTLDGRGKTESFGKLVSALRHNCSTLGGNSGSALVDIDTGLVAGLHFGGRYRDINYGVPASELARDPRVVDAGVQFDRTPGSSAPPPWDDWWNDRDETALVSRPGRRRPTPLSTPVPRASSGDSTVDIVIPLHITVNLADGTASITTASSEGDGAAANGSLVEKLVEPWHDDDYSSREGYAAKFLGIAVPMPKPANPQAVAPTQDGGSILHYQHFSIVMHATRRLALFTASNVTARTALKKPETGRQYTRKTLSGLGKNDQERWFADPRMDDIYQLPDVFYTRDDGAFDKGHIVRREDVAWGTSYDMLRRANGDTYHVTNCSPQVGGFNRATLGEDNWGDLEDHVLKGAASERYCQFAGPVLDPHDDTFIGSLGGGKTVRVKIPSRYWKVIVARTADGVASYGFVLEQDLSDIPVEEFVVPEQFVLAMKPLTEIQTLAGIRFPDVVIDSDQYGTDDGLELVMRAGLARGSGTVGKLDEGIVV